VSNRRARRRAPRGARVLREDNRLSSLRAAARLESEAVNAHRGALTRRGGAATGGATGVQRVAEPRRERLGQLKSLYSLQRVLLLIAVGLAIFGVLMVATSLAHF
jgi:hypothetical protein